MNCANHPDRERVAFCQNCGKAICQECTRAVGSAVFCEPCLAERLAGANSAASGSYPGPAEGTVAPPPPPVSGEPNPGLAGLLGIIPGVGAMYNGQYAKGIVHLVVFAILVSLSNENGIFGLFVAGWVVYQIIEAIHTARARRDGTPLPNPFGLNDLGEKLGFGKAWPTGAQGQPVQPVPGAAVPPTPGYPPYTTPPAAGFGPQGGQSWDWGNYAPPAQPGSPYAAPPFSPVDPNAAYQHNRFPSGAVWLIVLGALFLIGNSRLFYGFQMHWIIPFLLIGFGVWLFVQRMTSSGASLADDGSSMYRVRVVHAMNGAVWIVLIGVMFLLDSFHILSWGRSWPLFIIMAGLMAVLRRSAFSGVACPGYIHPPQQQPDAPPVPPTSPSETSTHDQEGR